MAARNPRYTISEVAGRYGVPQIVVDQWLQGFTSEEVGAMAADKSKSYLNLLITFYDNSSKRRTAAISSGPTPTNKLRAALRRPVRQQWQSGGPRDRGNSAERTTAPTAGAPGASGATARRGRPRKYRAAKRRATAPRGSAAIRTSAIAGTTAASGSTAQAAHPADRSCQPARAEARKCLDVGQ